MGRLVRVLLLISPAIVLSASTACYQRHFLTSSEFCDRAGSTPHPTGQNVVPLVCSDDSAPSSCVVGGQRTVGFVPAGAVAKVCRSGACDVCDTATVAVTCDSGTLTAASVICDGSANL